LKEIDGPNNDCLHFKCIDLTGRLVGMYTPHKTASIFFHLLSVEYPFLYDYYYAEMMVIFAYIDYKMEVELSSIQNG
jgi:hypothetical protein